MYSLHILEPNAQNVGPVSGRVVLRQQELAINLQTFEVL